MLLIAATILLAIFGAITGNWDLIKYEGIGLYAALIIGGVVVIVGIIAMMLWDAWKD